MRIFKKIIRKLYHLFWFLSVFLLFSPLVFATDGQINGSIYSSDISASAQAEWFDVNHNSISTSLVTDYGYSPYFKASSRYNSYLSFNVYTNFQTNTIYSLTIYLNASNNTNFNDWNNYVATGTWNGGANSNNSNGTCRAYVYSINNTYNIKYKINANQEGTSEAQTGAIYITFTPTCPGSYINIPVAFENPSGDMYFYGYHLEVLGLSDGLTSQQVQSIINNSGLATANSVSQVQQSITQVQQDIVSSSGSIINNQNENTEKQIESQEVCQQYDKSSMFKDNTVLSNSGVDTHDTRFVITDYIKIDKNSKIKLLYKNNTYQANICFYNINKTFISCQKQQDLTEGSILTIPNSASYVKMSIEKSTDRPTWSICKNGNQALNDSVNDLNDNITDSSIDSSDSTLNNLTNQIPTNSVISDLLLLPVRFLQNFVNALGSSCSQFNLGSLYGTNLFMPCINIENYLGTAIWTTIDLIISGMFVYKLRKKFIEIYENLTNLRNGGNEVD